MQVLDQQEVDAVSGAFTLFNIFGGRLFMFEQGMIIGWQKEI